MKTETELVARIDLVLTRLVKRFSPDIIVIACNTASTVALPKLRGKIKQPIIGVVPAIKPAAKLAKTKYIGLLATPGTVERSYTENLIERFGRGLNENPLDWIKVGSSDLVSLIESNAFSGKHFPSEKLDLILQPFIEKGALELDTIVLACTHFPLIIDELRSKLPHIKNWVDSGKAISSRVEFMLNELGQNSPNTICHEHCAVFTKEFSGESNCVDKLSNRAIGNELKSQETILMKEGLSSIHIFNVSN